MEVKCVIFDMDGLMFDTERIVSVLHKEAARYYGYDLTDAMIENLLGGNKERNTQYLLEQFGNTYPVEKVRARLLDKYTIYIEENGLPIKKGLKELLFYLKQKNILVAVGSSSPYKIVSHYLDISDTKQYVDYIITGDRVKQSKPHPAIFLNVCDHFQILPSEALVLEDSRNGIMAAVNGNIPVICIPDLVEHPSDIQALTYRTLPSLLDVIMLLKEELE